MAARLICIDSTMICDPISDLMMGLLRIYYNYANMVFYNKPLRAYFLIELKTVKLPPEAVGQFNIYNIFNDPLVATP